MSEEKIERCPKCNGYSLWGLNWYPEIEPGATGRMYEVRCTECGYIITAGTKKEAIDRWNLYAKLSKQIANGDLTIDEAEHEWQDYMHRDDTWREW